MRNFYLRSSFLLMLLFVLPELKAWAQVINFQQAEEFGILSDKDIISNTSILGYGSVGARNSITSNVQATERLLANGHENVPEAISVLQDNINYFSGLPGNNIDNQLSRQVLTAGVYSITSDAILDYSEYLELQGDSTSVFIFNINGDLTLQSLSKIIIGGVRPSNIYWNVSGKVYIESGVIAHGIFMSSASIYKTGYNFGKAALFALENIEISLSANLGIGHNGFYSPKEMLRGPGNPPQPYIACPTPNSMVSLLQGTPFYPNLVVNNSFEGAFRCPDPYPSILNSILVNTSDVCNWNAVYSPIANNVATPDYFNSCSTSPFQLDVPNNSFGHQTPHSGGNAYAGFYALTNNLVGPPNNQYIYDYREYLRQVLPADRALQAGTRYYGEYYVSLSEGANIAVKNLSMAVTDTAPAFINDWVIADPNRPAQIQYNGSYITDTAGWTRVSGAFNAAGGERIITLGNLNSYANTGWIGVHTTVQDHSYYFVDNVGLYELPDAGPNIVLSACNTITSFTLGRGRELPPNINPTYEWTADTEPNFFGNTLNITVSPIRPTTYTLTIKAHGQVISVTRASISGVIALGSPTNITTISAGLPRFNGTATFSGEYHVLGPLVLVGGEFHAEPGTIFNVEPENGAQAIKLNLHEFPEYLLQNNGKTYPTIIKVGQNGKLYLSGATLTTSLCTRRNKWGGLHLGDGGQIFTSSALDPKNPSVILKTTISEAYVGIGSSRLIGGAPTTNFNRYNLYETVFKNNEVGFHDYIKGIVSTPAISEGIQNCLFEENSTGIYFDDDIRIGVAFGGNYANGTYRLNKFVNNNYGIKGAANNLLLADNSFIDNAKTAIELNVDLAGNPAYRLNIIRNAFIIPDNALGIRANSGHIISTNTIEGSYTGSTSTGIIVNGSEEVLIDKENALKNLLIGVDAINPAYASLEVLNNTFEDNQTGIRFSVMAIDSTAPSIRCNTFKAPTYQGTVVTAKGIYLGQGARLVTFGNANDLGYWNAPNGNRFEFIDEPIRNDGVSPMTYHSYNSSQENWAGTIVCPTTSIPSTSLGNGGCVNVVATGIAQPVGACGSSTQPGVYARQSNSGPGVTQRTALEPETEFLSQTVPNPSQGNAAVAYVLPSNTSKAYIVVNDLITNQEIKRFTINPKKQQGTLEMNLSNARNGVYSYSLWVDDKPVSTRKLAIWK